MKDITFKGAMLMLAMALMIGLPLGGVGLSDVSAAYSKAVPVGFMGVDYANDLGNATGATTAVTPQSGAIPDEINCYFSVQNSSGVGIANNATVAIQSSYKGADWSTFATITVANSTVTGYRNTGGASGGSVPWGDQFRMNITAIQNSTNYVTGQCWFE